jgi:predicted RNase H-like HicB family nuclease
VTVMKLALVFEPVIDNGFPPGYYYAHIPTLGLTTHGEGIAGAQAAAEDLARLWIAEKTANGEKVETPVNCLFGTLEIPDDAVSRS